MNLFASTDAATMAAVHRQAFDDAWSEEAFAALLASPGVFALAVGPTGAFEGFILCRTVAGEAEVLTLAVVPAHRRRGVAATLLGLAMVEARRDGAETMFLEVAADNAAALALYRAAAFTQVGLRRGYYGSEGDDALVLQRDLNTPPAADYVSAEPRSD